MEPWQEPVRGGPLPPSAFSLSGLDQLRGYGRRWWESTAAHHLTGFRTTQVGPGSAVASMPVTPWLSHPDGVVDVGIMADAVCMNAAHANLPPRSVLVPLHLSYAPLRHVTFESRSLVGRAHVVRSAPYWVYTEGTVEDGDGRIVADASGHFLVTEADFPVPDEVPTFEPVDPPRYATPDPYQRPLAPDRYRAFDLFPEHGGVKAMEMIIAGDAPRPPLYDLLGIRPLEVAAGSVTTELTTSGWISGLDSKVSAGFVGACAVDACGGAFWTVGGPGVRVDILRFSMSYAGATPADGRALTVLARAEPLGDDVLTATVEVVDDDRRVASGSAGARIRRASGGERPAGTQPTRSLLTVLLTDIVGSTEHAERLGDARWQAVLDGHADLTGSEIEEAGGRLVKSTGDGVLATFDSPTRAVECARAIAEQVGRLGVQIRAGIHTGECEVSGGDVAGIAVHVAARIESAAAPGEVWVSETTRALTAGSGLAFSDRGEHRLKGLDGLLRLYRLE